MENHSSSIKSKRPSSLEEISQRSLRAYYEQYWYGENFLAEYLEINNFQGKNILEIGTAEGGLLKYFCEKGANCYGLDLSPVRYKNSLFLNNDKNNINLIFGDICNKASYKDKIKTKMDVIILRDVIEHIAKRDIALNEILNLLSSDGVVFISFPPKYSAYSGHQQIIKKKWSKLPYLYLLPNNLYKKYLKIIGQPKGSIDYLISTKQNRITVSQMRKMLCEIGFKIKKEDLYFLRPCYEFRFGLKPVKNPLYAISYAKELFTNGALYLLEK